MSPWLQTFRLQHSTAPSCILPRISYGLCGNTVRRFLFGFLDRIFRPQTRLAPSNSQRADFAGALLGGGISDTAAGIRYAGGLAAARNFRGDDRRPGAASHPRRRRRSHRHHPRLDFRRPHHPACARRLRRPHGLAGDGRLHHFQRAHQNRIGAAHRAHVHPPGRADVAGRVLRAFGHRHGARLHHPFERRPLRRRGAANLVLHRRTVRFPSRPHRRAVRVVSSDRSLSKHLRDHRHVHDRPGQQSADGADGRRDVSLPGDLDALVPGWTCSGPVLACRHPVDRLSHGPAENSQDARSRRLRRRRVAPHGTGEPRTEDYRRDLRFGLRSLDHFAVSPSGYHR